MHGEGDTDMSPEDQGRALAATLKQVPARQNANGLNPFDRERRQP